MSHIPTNRDVGGEDKISRVQARKAILGMIEPELRKLNFLYGKGSCLWRVGNDRTDVVEIRFLTAAECLNSKLPESTFSVKYGCYFYFVPSPFEDKITCKIDGLITPEETHCHIRCELNRHIEQSSLKKHKDSFWHLECSVSERQFVYDDIMFGLREQAIPLLARFDDIPTLLDYLKQSKGVQIGIGAPGSFARNYLLGFTHLKLGQYAQAENYLKMAKEFVDEANRKNAKQLTTINSNTPVFVQQRILEQALTGISSGRKSKN